MCKQTDLQEGETAEPSPSGSKHDTCTSVEEDEQEEGLPTSPWLHDHTASDAERLRRRLVLRKVCDKLLVVPAECRAKSLSALANQTKALRSIKTYTVPPHKLLTCLHDVPQSVISILQEQRIPFALSSTLLEDVEPELVGRVSQHWNRLEREGWTTKTAPAEVARFIQNSSYTSRSYPIEVIVDALQDLLIINNSGQFHWQNQKLSRKWLARVLPRCELDITRSWGAPEYGSVTHTVRKSVVMPALASGAFFGLRGEAVKQFLQHLEETASGLEVAEPPKVYLKVKATSKSSPHIVELTIKWVRWEKGKNAKAAAAKVDSMIDDMVGELRDHISVLYKTRLERNALRRKGRADHLQKVGEAYHGWRRAERIRRTSAHRALEVAPPCTSRKMRQGCSFQRKDIPRQRRQAKLCEKRCKQLKACEELSLWHSRVGAGTKDFTALGDNCKGYGQRLQKHLRNCDSDKAEELLQRFTSLRNARDWEPRRHRLTASKKQKETARWKRALLDFDVV